jgi:hypothetical protein
MGALDTVSVDELTEEPVSATNIPAQIETNLVQSLPDIRIGRVIYVDQKIGSDVH